MTASFIGLSFLTRPIESQIFQLLLKGGVRKHGSHLGAVRLGKRADERKILGTKAPHRNHPLKAKREHARFIEIWQDPGWRLNAILAGVSSTPKHNNLPSGALSDYTHSPVRARIIRM
ncbi:hypothetical protein AB0L34_09610 [Micromonospora sp. NPDC052213]|uniref:hypothetical protein n=1 Tax=Micromonospora sp. NPDC052213 TaxID=3155812 RepID=UPI003427B0EA